MTINPFEQMRWCVETLQSNSPVQRSRAVRRRWQWPFQGTYTSSATAPPTCPLPAAKSRALPESPGSPIGQDRRGRVVTRELKSIKWTKYNWYLTWTLFGHTHWDSTRFRRGKVTGLQYGLHLKSSRSTFRIFSFRFNNWQASSSFDCVNQSTAYL